MPDTLTAPSPQEAMSKFRTGIADSMKEVNPPKAEPPAAVAGMVPAAVPATPPSEPSKPAETPSDKWPRTAQEWKKFTEARDKGYAERDARIKEFEARVTDYEARLKTGVSAPELESLKSEKERLAKEAEEYSNQLRVVSVENHPKFKAYFDNKISAQTDMARRIVGTEKAEQAAQILSLPDGPYRDSQIETMLAELTPLQQSRFGAVVNALSEIQSERASEVAKARDNYTKLQSEEQERVKSRQTEIQKTVESVIAKAQSKEGMAAYQLKDGDEAWNKAVSARLDSAKAIMFGQATLEQIARAALDAAASPALLQQVQSLMDENTKLQEQVKSLTSATPRASGGASETPSGDQPQRVEIKTGSNPMEAAAAWTKSLQRDYSPPR